MAGNARHPSLSASLSLAFSEAEPRLLASERGQAECDNTYLVEAGYGNRQRRGGPLADFQSDRVRVGERVRAAQLDVGC
jgi:hypothetical protein